MIQYICIQLLCTYIFVICYISAKDASPENRGSKFISNRVWSDITFRTKVLRRKFSCWQQFALYTCEFHIHTVRVARWHFFKPKIPIWVNLGRSCYERCCYIIWPFGLFYGVFGIVFDHWVYFKVIWYIFFRFGMLHQEKSGNRAHSFYVRRKQPQKVERLTFLKDRSLQTIKDN
jgi:hypothetical protein